MNEYEAAVVATMNKPKDPRLLDDAVLAEWLPGEYALTGEEARDLVDLLLADRAARIELLDTMTCETLLRKWRFAPAGDVMFQGETGKYYSKVMSEKRDADPRAAVAASKTLGWD